MDWRFRLIFGILVSTLLTLVVIPTLYYAAYRNKFGPATAVHHHNVHSQGA
jgi:hypothetical protein